ncbi:MAG TPA: transglycosylase domain-containing protein [Candidatus Limnocylindrales bacterium]
MQTSLARRERQRRNGTDRRGGGGPGRGVAVALPIFLFLALSALALSTFVGVVAGYTYFARDLPDPKAVFSNLAFSQQTVVTDASGKVELARFGDQKRELVPYDQIPPLLIDATTSIEDKTFWTNAGFDPLAFVKATYDTMTGNARGASTITQQLVRARLLPQSAFTGSTYERKIKEIIQSIRLTQAYPGDEGKRQIMEAYLNQNFYGNQSYGIKAAAKSYFGVTDLSKLTIAQAAILAAIPKSPTTYDLVANAVKVTGADGKPQLVVPSDTEIVQRRNYVLDLMTTNRVLTVSTLTDAQIEAAKNDPVVLAPQAGTNWRAPHFVWQVRKELAAILCGSGQESCDRLDNGGYRVTTTLDWNMQRSAEKWVKAAVLAPNASNTKAYLTGLKVPDAAWIENLRGKGVKNGAMIAIDYRTGHILAYVGSANYYAASDDPKFQPKFDVLADGWRQPGSAMKPINYITGIEARTMTAATMIMDVATDFGGGYVPLDADKLERGPLRMRQALQFSLNIPAVKAAVENGPDNVFAMAKRFGLSFQSQTNVAGASIALGTLEIHPDELVSAYGAIADGGVLMPRTTIAKITDSSGAQIWPEPAQPAPTGRQVVSQQAAYIITNILSGNTDPNQNPYWGKFEITDNGQHRPAALKTGTTNDTKDLAAYGFLAPPADGNAPAIAVGVWMGNSDNSQTGGVFSLDSTAPLWQSFLAEVSKGDPIADFPQPAGIVQAKVDAWSGMLPGPFTTATVTENFIDGTVPTKVDDTKVAVDVDSSTGNLWQDGCAGPKVIKGFLDLSHVESDYPQWRQYTNDWIARAHKGVGVSGGPPSGPDKLHGSTAYFYERGYMPYGASWGAPWAPTTTCSLAPPSPSPCDPTLGPCPSESPGTTCDPTLGPCPSEPPPSLGPTPPLMTKVPNLVCQTLGNAVQTLAAAGLGLGGVSPGNAPSTYVVGSESPPAGTEVQPGSLVNVKLVDPKSIGCPSG